MQVLLAQDLIEAKWKNGGGITRNIATGILDGATAWRVSRADVDVEGPFSNFAGMTRILTVVSPNTMELVHNSALLTARSWEPVEFDGGLAVDSRLPEGPLTDLNLMFDPELCSGTAQVKQGPDSVCAPQDGHLCILHVLAGHPRCNGDEFDAADTLFVGPNCQAPVALGQGDAVLQLSIAATDQSADIRLCIADR